MNHRLRTAFSLAGLAALALMPLAPAGAQPQPQPQTQPQPQRAEGRAYTPGMFDAIEITGSAVVRFTQGASDEVFVEGDDEVQRSVSIEVQGRTLNVRPAGSWKFWNARRLQIAVTSRALRSVTISGAADLNAGTPVKADRLVIEISGAGKAKFEDLKADRLDFHVSGAGDGQMAGAVRTLNVEISGKSRFGGEHLMSERARVAVSGIADIDVWTTQDLSVAVSGIGTVNYWGNPTVRRSVSGRATLNDRGPQRPAPMK